MNNFYTIHIHNRNYTSWEVFDINNNKYQVEINPLENKLLNNDIFSVNCNKISIIHSSIRSGPPIPGVLILDGNKTYGREKKNISGNQSKNNGNRLLYKFIPDDIKIPSFLVPYEIKSMGFIKVLKNLYATVNFDNWQDKHPIAKLDNVIGSVDILDNFYEYQLYCKKLNASIQTFHRDTMKSLKNNDHDIIIEKIKNKYKDIEDRTDKDFWHIITIDPLNSQDFDDGFSIVKLENEISQLSIYISNVTIWMDILKLWDSFSRRVSSIYLPDKKRPMLPSILSDCLCSLQENVTRISFVMDIFIKNNDIIDIQFRNALIKVSHNYVYEDAKLLADCKYHSILECTQELSKKYKYINSVQNSHELVSYLMIFMNYHCANQLIKHKTGIFRSTLIKKDLSIPDSLPEDVSKFMKIWNSTSAIYIDGSVITDTKHELLDLDAYIHITSPIRRLVDLLNMMRFQIVINKFQFSYKATEFYEKWLNDIEYINATMRSIRKVQSESTLLNLCDNDPNVMEKEYNGYLFDKLYRNDGLYQYIVYLPELRLSNRLITKYDMDNFTKKSFRLYLFHDEEKFKNKIRLHLI
jgi:exoribonuclease R